MRVRAVCVCECVCECVCVCKQVKHIQQQGAKRKVLMRACVVCACVQVAADACVRVYECENLQSWSDCLGANETNKQVEHIQQQGAKRKVPK